MGKTFNTFAFDFKLFRFLLTEKFYLFDKSVLLDKGHLNW